MGNKQRLYNREKKLLSLIDGYPVVAYHNCNNPCDPMLRGIGACMCHNMNVQKRLDGDSACLYEHSLTDFENKSIEATDADKRKSEIIMCYLETMSMVKTHARHNLTENEANMLRRLAKNRNYMITGKKINNYASTK